MIENKIDKYLEEATDYGYAHGDKPIYLYNTSFTELTKEIGFKIEKIPHICGTCESHITNLNECGNGKVYDAVVKHIAGKPKHIMVTSNDTCKYWEKERDEQD